MPALTWYLTNNSVSIGSDLSETDPGAEAYRSAVTGWVVGITGTGNYSSYRNDVEQTNATFGATAQPDGTLDTTNGDFWTSPTALTGSFAATDWLIHAAVRAQTRASSQDGRIRARVFRGANQDGSGAVEITSAAADGTVVTDLLTTVTQVSTVTVNPGAFSVMNEYVFIQLAWEITGASGFATADVNIRIGNGSSAGSRVITSEFTAGSAGSSVAPKLSTGIPEKKIKAVPFESNAGYKLLITDHTGTISDDPAEWPPELKAAVTKCCCQKTSSSSMISKALYPSPCCPTMTADTLSGRVAGTVAHNTSIQLRYNAGYAPFQGSPPNWLPIEGVPAASFACWWSDLYEDFSFSVNASGVWRVNTGNIFTPFVDVPYSAVFDCNVYFYVKYGHRLGQPPNTCNSTIIQIAYPVGQFNYDPVAYQQCLNLFVTMPQNPEPITWNNLLAIPPGAGGIAVRNALGLSGLPNPNNIVSDALTGAGCNSFEVHQCNNILQHRGIYVSIDQQDFPTMIAPITYAATSGLGTMQVYMVSVDREPAYSCSSIPPQPINTRPRIEVDA